MRLTAGAFRQLRFTGLLLLLAIITAAGAVYWSSVQQQRRYLSSRDFRLLTGLASQTQNLIDGNVRMFQSAISSPRDMDTWLTEARPSLPILKDVAILTKPTTPVTTATDARFIIEDDTPRSGLRLEIAPAGVDKPVLTARVAAAALLGPTFTSKLRQGVFDTLVLATSEGRVIYATGRRQQELRSAPLDTVLTPKELEGGKTFQQLARTISVRDAVLAGVNYKLFVQPCCEMMTVQASARPGESPRRDMIVAGLIESDVLDGAALAISYNFVVVAIVSVLMALVVWPFLKLTFLGERQRVTTWDLVQLGACSVFGLALGAIIVITADVYTRLTADVDEQLEGLAQELRAHLSREVELAYDQLTDLEQQLRDHPRGAIPIVSMAGKRYPDYETFALIDGDGWQQVKSGPDRWVPGLVSVRDRMYFQAVRSGRYWRDLRACTGTETQAPSGCVLESLWSLTTGQQQAVVSKPTGKPTLPVAALAIPMRSLRDPVLPPGFEYAIIDSTGAVLFHSDSQRNALEDLFLETDRDRRLRAMIAGHSSGPFSTMYWGRPYRAYVERAGIPDWSIVTLSDKQGTRGLVLEWTAVSLLLLSVYLTAWGIAMLLALRMGASWLWPDARRRWRYVILSVAYASLFGIFTAATFSGDSKRLLTTGMAIAAAAWILAFVVLRERPPAVEVGARRSRTAAREYAVAGALFLVLSGVVPGVAFVVRSYDLHVESYVKHRQLGLARADAAASSAAAVRTNEGRQAAPTPELSALGSYHSFFYATQLKKQARASESGHKTEGHHDLLLSMLEEYLPYYTESSVEMRELLHDHSGGEPHTWASSRTADGRLELRVASDTPGMELIVSSLLPAPVPFWSSAASRRDASVATASDRGHDERTLIMPYLAPVLLVSLVLVAYAIVVFLQRHVYLSGVAEPLWASARLVATAGDNLLVLCENSEAMARQIEDVSKLKLGPIVRSDDPAAVWTRARIRISGGDRARAVVIDDLDSELEEVELTHKKVELLEELVEDPARTVVVLLQNSPAMLQGSVRPGQHGPDRELWTRLFKAFVVLDWRDAPDDACGGIPVTVTPSPGPRWRRWIGDRVPGSNAASDVLEEEGRGDRFVRQICQDIRASKAFQLRLLSPEQILDEIEERASNYYQRLWDTCSDDERVVLGHVAQYGLTNAASRRVVRRLLVRRLLTKDPDLRLMNQSFRNFILSPRSMRQVTQLEGLAGPSTWDRLRMPFALGAVAAGAFLFTTQRDMFNETVTGLAALAAAVPTAVRVVSMMARRDADPAREQPTA